MGGRYFFEVPPPLFMEASRQGKRVTGMEGGIQTVGLLDVPEPGCLDGHTGYGGGYSPDFARYSIFTFAVLTRGYQGAAPGCHDPDEVHAVTP